MATTASLVQPSPTEKTKAADAAAAENTIQYTIFASGINWGGRSQLLGQKNRTDDVAIIFDVVTDTTYTKSYQKSQYALESKAQASDHVQEQDGKFSFTGQVSDVPTYVIGQNYLDRDTDLDNPMLSKRATHAAEILQLMASQKNMIGIVTEDNILTGYVITNLTINRSADSGSALTFQIEMEEFRRIAIGKVVLASTPSSKAGKKNGGAKQTAEGGTVSNEAEGKKNPSPYISKHAKNYEAVDKAVTGNTYDDPTANPGGTIRPDGKFNSNNLLR